jgi:hypothetical protein
MIYHLVILLADAVSEFGGGVSSGVGGEGGEGGVGGAEVLRLSALRLTSRLPNLRNGRRSSLQIACSPIRSGSYLSF